jgi:hypothetical protein
MKLTDTRPVLLSAAPQLQDGDLGRKLKATSPTQPSEKNGSYQGMSGRRSLPRTPPRQADQRMTFSHQ